MVVARSPLVHLVMPIQSVLSSASIMRLTAPGAPSLMETGFGERDGTTVLWQIHHRQIAAKKAALPSGIGFWPTTYSVELSTSALLAPPGIRLCIGTAWC
jgi:hypothetical protein